MRGGTGNGKRYVLFDLDGTLTDPGIGITNSVAWALSRFGREVPDRKLLYPFIGPPLLESFQKFCGFSPEESRQALVYYREYFAEKGIFENEVYPGIPDLLRELREKDLIPVLATSKPQPFAETVLQHFGLDGYFGIVSGATMDEKRTAKADVIRHAMHLGGFSAEDAVMVGDREHDILGARENSMYAVGVLYGYGSREELTAAGADALIEKPGELLSLSVFAAPGTGNKR